MITQHNTKIKVSQNSINVTMLKAGSNSVKALKQKNKELFISSIVILNNTLEEQVKYLYMKKHEKVLPECSLQKLAYFLQMKSKDVYRIKQSRNLIVHAVDQVKIASLFMTNEKENKKMISGIRSVVWQIQNLLYSEDLLYKQRVDATV